MVAAAVVAVTGGTLLLRQRHAGNVVRAGVAAGASEIVPAHCTPNILSASAKECGWWQASHCSFQAAWTWETVPGE